MPELRGFSGQAVVGILQRMGFDLRRSKGSHVVLRRDGVVCVVPMHNELAVGTLRSVLRQAGRRILGGVFEELLTSPKRPQERGLQVGRGRFWIAGCG